MGNNRLVELHCHSLHSPDGENSVHALMDRAVKKNLEYFSITDHNNIAYIKDYLRRKNLKGDQAYYKFGDTKYIPGVELTCRINDKKANNRKGNASKIHMLIYSPIVDQNDMLFQLMKLKHENDISYDFGPLIQMAKLKDVELVEKDVRIFVKEKRDLRNGFSDFGMTSTYEYFERYYPGLFKDRAEFEDLYRSINEYARLNVDARYAIELAHKNGAFCIMAHPDPTLGRIGSNATNAIDCLVDYGIDGFEMIYPSANRKTSEMIEKTIGRHDIKNPMIYTGGTDFHRKVDWRDLGQFRKSKDSPIMEYLYTKNCTNFAKEIEKLNSAREEKELTHREYKQVSVGKLSSKLESARKFVENNRIEGDTMIYNKEFDYSIPEFDEELSNTPL